MLNVRSYILDDIEFTSLDTSEKELILSRNEALYLSDNVTLMIERDQDETVLIGSMRNVAPTAPLPVPIEIIEKIGLAILYTTDPDNIGKDYIGMFDINELYLLREIAQSFVKINNESVGYNLSRKIYTAILQDKYEQDKILNSLLTSDEPLNKTLEEFPNKP